VKQFLYRKKSPTCFGDKRGHPQRRDTKDKIKRRYNYWSDRTIPRHNV